MNSTQPIHVGKTCDGNATQHLNNQTRDIISYQMTVL